MFLHLSVSHSVHRGGVCPSACWDTHTPLLGPEAAPTPWEIRVTSGRYASYWNAYLFRQLFRNFLIFQYSGALFNFRHCQCLAFCRKYILIVRILDSLESTFADLWICVGKWETATQFMISYTFKCENETDFFVFFLVFNWM